MSDPITSVFTNATEVLTLTSELARLIEESEASGGNRDNLTQILARLRGESVGIAQELARQLRAMLEDFDGFPLDKSIPSMIEDLSWYNFIRRHRLKSARDRFYEMYRVLTSFLDDVTAVLVCAGTANTARSAFWTGIAEKEGLDKLMASRPPVKKLLTEMIAAADSVAARLQGATPRK